jgi:hypothetical protein
MSTIQSRRQLIVVLLLCVAVIAAVVRHQSAPGTTTRDVSTVLMLLWLPVLGSILGWCIARLPRRRQAAPAGPAGFAANSPFQPQLQVEFSLRRSSVPAENTPLAAGEHRAVLVVANQGFQMRWRVAAGAALPRGEAHALPIELLSPATALPQLPPGTDFRLLVGESFIGDGRVLAVLPARTDV